MKQRQASAYILIFIGLSLIALAIFSVFSNFNSQKTKIILGNSVIVAEVADSEEKRSQGLGGRTRLGDNEGMLFVFEADDRHAVWMRDMKFDIDIIWLDRDKKVVSMVKGASAKSFPRQYKPAKYARYVLEVPANFTARENIKINTIADFNVNAL